MKSVNIFLLLIPVFCFGQFEEYIEKDPEPIILDHRGFVYSLLETGSGLGIFYEIPLSENFWHVGFNFDIIMVRDKNQLETINYFGQPITFNKRNNVFLFDLMVSAKKRLFVTSFDDSFRPYVFGGIGPLYGVNFPEDDAFTGIKLSNQDEWIIAGMIGLGIDADVDGGYYVGFRTQYRFMPFIKQLGETKDHSMIDIRFEIGQRF